MKPSGGSAPRPRLVAASVLGSLSRGKKNGGDDETRTRDLCRDRAEITSTYNNLQGCWGLPSTCKDAVTGQITGWSSGWRVGKIPN